MSNNKKINMIDIADIDVSKITYSIIKDNAFGKMCYIRYDNNSYHVKLVNMRFPFGASKFQKKEDQQKKSTDDDKYSISCELSPEMADILNNLDDAVFEYVLANIDKVASTLKILLVNRKGERYSPDEIRKSVEEKHNRLVKYSKKNGVEQKQYPPSLRISIPYAKSNGDSPPEFSCEFYTDTPTEKSKLVKLSACQTDENFIEKQIPSNSSGSILTFPLSIWFGMTGFSITFKAFQVKFEQRKTLPKGVFLLDSLVSSSQPANTLANMASLEVSDPDFTEEEQELLLQQEQELEHEHEQEHVQPEQDQSADEVVEEEEEEVEVDSVVTNFSTLDITKDKQSNVSAMLAKTETKPQLVSNTATVRMNKPGPKK